MPVDFASAAAESTEAPRPPPYSRPRRSNVALMGLLAILAVLLLVQPGAHRFYPQVIVQVGDVLQLDFLLNPLHTRAACQDATRATVTLLAENCPTCRVVQQSCQPQLTAETLDRFTEKPLALPSARIADGVIVYSAAVAETALAACRSSETRAASQGEHAKVVCYGPGEARPHTPFELATAASGALTFQALLALEGLLIASVVVTLGSKQFLRQRRMEGSASMLAAAGTLPRRERRTAPLTLLIVDAAVLLGTFLALAWPSGEDIHSWSRLQRNTVLGQGLVIAITLGWFWLLLQHYQRRRPFWDELREVMRVLLVMLMVSGAAAFVLGESTSRMELAQVWALNFALIPIGRAVAKQLLDDLGLWQRPALIVGTGENAYEALLAIQSERGLGYDVMGFVDPRPGIPEGPRHLSYNDREYPVFQVSALQPERLTELGQPQVVVALESLLDSDSQRLIQRLLARHTEVHVIPALRGLPLFGTRLSHFFSHEVLFLTVQNNLSRRSYAWIKRGFDVLVAGLFVIVLSPLLAYLAWQIRKDGGPALYGHPRVGRHGRSFKCLKFRSMRTDSAAVLKELLETDAAARDEWARDFKLKNDPRITAIGHFLRRTSLDELPQLFNVLRGDMSLVGPRPVITAELERYGDYVDLYLQVLPGLTGLWQVSGRNDTTYAQRVRLDAWYVQNWSLWYDIAILFRTVDVVLARKGAY